MNALIHSLLKLRGHGLMWMHYRHVKSLVRTHASAVGWTRNSNNNNNNNNFISIALLSYVQGALQSCKQHYWKIFTNLQPYPNIFTMDKKGKN